MLDTPHGKGTLVFASKLRQLVERGRVTIINRYCIPLPLHSLRYSMSSEPEFAPISRPRPPRAPAKSVGLAGGGVTLVRPPFQPPENACARPTSQDSTTNTPGLNESATSPVILHRASPRINQSCRCGGVANVGSRIQSSRATTTLQVDKVSAIQICD